MPSSHISQFWASHPECWIPITAAQKAVADKLIYENFYKYDYESESLAGRVIFLDQFQRHFARHVANHASQDERHNGAPITEADILACRLEAAEDVERNADELICQDEVDLVACLMPFKHLGRYEYIFEYLHNIYLPDKELELKSCPVLSHFYYDTYRKWQTDETVAAALWLAPATTTWTYSAADICESDDAPESLEALTAQMTDPHIKELVAALRDAPPTVVSLSGGIDSMVALAILKALGTEVSAVHIIYGNRATSSDEFSFVARFCQRLAIPLTVYEIPYLRRDFVDREFYESVTRSIRFSAYKALAAVGRVLLGHIQDDAVENIWTNFARGLHLDNLSKMEVEEVQLGINLWRPLLHIKKSAIYAAATTSHIPHLKNTTPSWCNRGKFREHFYAQTHAQYGPEVDAKLLEVADTLKAQSALIECLLYKQIYDSWNPDTNTVNVEPALKVNLDAASWLKIFEHICHKYLKVNRPSIHAAREFMRRLRLTPKCLKMNVGKGISITLTGTKLMFEIIPYK